MKDKVTTEQIIDYVNTLYEVCNLITPEKLRQIAKNNLDENNVDELYLKGYRDALEQIINYFEKRASNG